MIFPKYTPINGDSLLWYANGIAYYITPNGSVKPINVDTASVNSGDIVSATVTGSTLLILTKYTFMAYDLEEGDLMSPKITVSMSGDIYNDQGLISVSEVKGWACGTCAKGWVVIDYINGVVVHNAVSGVINRINNMAHLSPDGDELLAQDQLDDTQALLYDTSDWSVKDIFLDTGNSVTIVGYVDSDWIVMGDGNANTNCIIRFINRADGSITLLDVGYGTGSKRSHVVRIGDHFCFILGFYSYRGTVQKYVDTSSGIPTLGTISIDTGTNDNYDYESVAFNRGFDSFRSTSAGGVVAKVNINSDNTVSYSGYATHGIGGNVKYLKLCCLIDNIDNDNIQYKVVVSVVESLVIDDFLVEIYSIDGSSLITSKVVQSGTNDIPTMSYNKPVIVTIRPNVTGTWVKNSEYIVGNVIFPNNTLSTPYMYRCIVGGYSGGVEPFWTQTQGAQQVDNNVTWECVEHNVNPCSKAPVMPIPV